MTIPPPDALVPDVLRDGAARHPDRRAFVFVDGHGAEEASLTYAELHRRALAVAHALARDAAPGDRALLVFPPGLDFVVAWFGCLYAGVIAVPVDPPRPDRVTAATRSIVRDSAPVVALTTTDPGTSLAAGLPWLGVLGLPDAPDPGRFAGAHDPDAVAFLQYTSGSTAAPKGVMVTHGNLAANEAMIAAAFGHDEGSTFVGWAPLFHDQGLIGNVLQPLWLGTTSVLMAPASFVRRPLLWLETITRYRAHTSGGPNFAFDACVARAAGADLSHLDLSSWRVAFNGAEPLRAETLRRFAGTFAAHGLDPGALYPCYGLAEATLLVTASRKGRGPRFVDADVGALGRGVVAPGPGRTLVGSGEVLPGEEVRIVDPTTGSPCASDRIGEVWVAGPQVAAGYWRRPEATATTFRARLAGSEADFLRTGDLGVLVDGELHVVGRFNDLVVVRGRNHHPADIEHTAVAAHPAVRPGGAAAFGVSGAEGERLVVVAELRREVPRDLDTGTVAAEVRAAVVREHAVTPEIVLTRAGTVAKTSSGKIMRAAARTRYGDEGFPAPAPAADLVAPSRAAP